MDRRVPARNVRLFLDECVSPRIADCLNALGHVATSVRDLGSLGDPDYQVLRQCIDRDSVLVTQDARDFRNLIAKKEIHPGLIILPNLDRDRSTALLRKAIAHLESCGDPMDVMVNRVLEMTADGRLSIHDLPAAVPASNAEPAPHGAFPTSSPGPP